MTKDLTKISGIGENSANNLRAAGFDSVESIASASIEELGKVNGFGPGRAERVISKAKEMTEAAEITEVPEVTETVTVDKSDVNETQSTATAKVKEDKEAEVIVVNRFGFFSTPRLLISLAAAIVLFLFAAIYFDLLGGIQSFNLTSSTTEQAVVDGKSSNDNSGTIAGQQSFKTQQQQMQQQFQNRIAEQRNQQQAAQKAQLEKYQAQVQEQKRRSEVFKAKAEQQAQKSWEQFLSTLPPAQAQIAIQQREFANKRMAEARARHEEFLRQHKARVEARSKNRFGS